MSFDNYGFAPEILQQIKEQKYEAPTPIQAKAIPEILSGKDIMGLAQTGTGKTAAFVLPMLQKFISGPRGRVRGLVIAPTRELAEQIHQAIIIFGKAARLTSTPIYGGVSYNAQATALRKGPEIVVACPGRLLDHLKQGAINLLKIEILVLDEADQMFDMGFLPDIQQIIRYLPPRRQTMLFSATMPEDIRKLAHTILRNPTTVEAEHTRAVETITHAVFPVSQNLKTTLLLELLKRTASQQILIFTRTKHRAKKLDHQLQSNGYRAASLQGNMTQNRRQAVMQGFREGEYDILVATDIAARGIDVSQVSHVINYDFPDTPEAYTHRIGRTGRASRKGDAFSFITPEDNYLLNAVEKKIGQKIPVQKLEGFNYEDSTQSQTRSEEQGSERESRKRHPRHQHTKDHERSSQNHAEKHGEHKHQRAKAKHTGQKPTTQTKDAAPKTQHTEQKKSKEKIGFFSKLFGKKK